MTESFWQRARRKYQDRSRADVSFSENYDIAVIGGGIVGIAVAYYLKKYGCRKVITLEKNFVGAGASGKNAGFIIAGLAEPYSRLVVGMGEESAGELMKSTVENHDLIEAAVKENGLACGYQRSGSYHLAVSEVERKELEDSVDLLNSRGFECEYRKEIEIPGDGRLRAFAGGSFSPGDGRIDPFAFVNGLASKLDVVEDFEVLNMAGDSRGVRITGRKGTIRSEMAVVAVNGYAPLLDRYFEGRIFPVRGQMLATSPLGGDVLGEPVYYANFGYDYFRQTGDNVLLAGGLRNRFVRDEVGYSDETSPGLQTGLEKYISDNLGITNFKVDSRWSGVMGNTIDGLPLVGALPHKSSILAAVGFNGHGFGLGMVVARDLARAIMKGDGSWLLRRFSIKRFVD